MISIAINPAQQSWLLNPAHCAQQSWWGLIKDIAVLHLINYIFKVYPQACYAINYFGIKLEVYFLTKLFLYRLHKLINTIVSSLCSQRLQKVQKI